MNKSIWDEIKIKEYKELDKNITVDILIIGGGITGINTLYELKDKNVCLVERNRIGRGVTLNTTGKLTYLQDILLNIINNNEKKATNYLKKQIEAIKIIKNRIEKNNIECDFTKTKSYLYVNNNVEDLKKIKKFLQKNKIKVNENDLNLLRYKYSISVDDTYLFNPLKYIKELLNLINKNIYENTNIVDIKYKDNKYICSTEKYKIIANKVILATHYPYFIYPYFFPLKAYLEKSYLVAYKKPIGNISLISLDKPVISIRNYKDYVIYLTNSHNICNKVNDKEKFKEIPNKKIEYMWSNTDIITSDNIPYIGYIKDNLILATGYNTWGMTNSVVASKIIKELIENKKNKYIDLFDPLRINNKKRIIGNICSTLKGYYEGLKYKSDKIKYTKINGIDVIIYNDGKKEYIVKRKCPHAKCNLIFNETELTFDCPCHASRFDLEGNVIKGPSKYNIKIDKY